MLKVETERIPRDSHREQRQPPPPSISNYVNLDVGWGGVVSFELKSHLSTHSFCSGLKLFKMAESLGAVESLVEVPFEMMGFPSEEKVRMG